jgi:transposase
MNKQESLRQVILKSKCLNTNPAKVDFVSDAGKQDCKVLSDDLGLIRQEIIHLKLNVAQRKLVKKWFHLYRSFYNRVVNYINDCRRQHVKTKLSFAFLRDEFKHNDSKEFTTRVKNSKMQSHLIDEALRDAWKAFNSNMGKWKINPKHRFRLRRKRNSSHQTISIPADAFSSKHNSFYVKSLGKHIKSDKQFKDLPKSDSRLQMKRGKFRLFMPIAKPVLKAQGKGIIALDPGVRTFLTGYDSNQNYCEIHTDIKEDVKKLDRVAKFKKERWYKKYTNRIKDRIDHKVDDLHYKTAVGLCQQYAWILLGDMSTQGVVSSGKLHKSVKKELHFFKPYTFKLRLMAYAQRSCTAFKYVDEAYTSKLCGNCGAYNNIGSSKTYNCSQCDYVADRDVNGARNILIRGIH